VPVSLARAWDPGLPVVGVLADVPKPAFLASRVGSSVLRATSRRLGIGASGDSLSARRFLALLAARWADPVVEEPPDVLIVPRLGRTNALNFGRSRAVIAAGEAETRAVLDALGEGAELAAASA
jgi:predicted acylesterase/phospholipase RssA